MPSNQSPLGALPSRFRRERVLVVGCGDVGMRAVATLRGRVTLRALTSSPARLPELRAAGVAPIVGNLDRPASLARMAGVATRVLHLAPPPGEGEHAQWWRDSRTVALTRALLRRTAPSSLIYVSTSGVYGDCGGDFVPESRPVAPRTPRAQRRVDAERAVRHFGRVAGTHVGMLRAPGIYAPDRAGGTPVERLRRGTPVLAREDDVYTNHIHADDLARAVVSAMWRARPQRAYNVNDDTQLKMGDWFDFAADRYGLPRPPRVPRSTAQDQLPLSLLGFMSESRRLVNTRMKRELRVRLRYPTVREGLGATREVEATANASPAASR